MGNVYKADSYKFRHLIFLQKKKFLEHISLPMLHFIIQI